MIHAIDRRDYAPGGGYVYGLMYDNASELAGAQVVTVEYGAVLCRPGSMAWRAGHADVMELDGSGVWQACSGGDASMAAALGNTAFGGVIIDINGIPEYITDFSEYADYGIDQPGWYAFARITSRKGYKAAAGFEVTGAAGYIEPAVGDGYVDVAVGFAVAVMSQPIHVCWDGEHEEVVTFRAIDLAIRNLDYRVTYYLYDLDPYCQWTYALTTDTTFAAGKHYFTKSGDVYTEAEVTVGAAVPANTYYKHSALTISGFVRNVSYCLPYIDCPATIALPEVEEDGYGAWIELQTLYPLAAYSVTFTLPAGVTISKQFTQNTKQGVNIINAQYHGVAKMWRLTVTTWDAAAAST